MKTDQTDGTGEAKSSPVLFDPFGPVPRVGHGVGQDIRAAAIGKHGSISGANCFARLTAFHIRDRIEK